MATMDSVRQPPQDLEAEMALLGALLLEPQSIGQVLQVVPREESHYLYRPDHRKLYETLIDLYDQNRPIDFTTLRDELLRRNLFDEVGGEAYLIRLLESVPSAANCEYYAGIVRDKGLLREVIRSTTRIQEAAYDTTVSTAEFLDIAEKEIFDVTERRVRGRISPLRDVLHATIQQIAQRRGHTITGVPTGFVELSEITSGFQPGEMIIVAARPSMGKTALALSMAEHISVHEGLGCVLFSLEMSKQQVALRLLSSHTSIDAHQIRRGMINNEELDFLRCQAEFLAEKPFYVDDTPGMTVMELRAKARRMKMQHDIRVIFVDYLQLLSEPKSARESRQQEISSISRALKALARELEIPVVAMAQLNRDPEKRTDNRPRMSDLRESGAIEQDADVVILLHREAYFKTPQIGRSDADAAGANAAGDNELDSKTELIVAKQRNGPTGTIEITFHKRFARFRDIAAPGVTDDTIPRYAAQEVPGDYQDTDPGVPF